MNKHHQEHAKHPHSLEAERQAILDRMQQRREDYRRLLNDEEELPLNPRNDASLNQTPTSKQHRSSHVQHSLHEGGHEDLQRSGHSNFDTHIQPLAAASHLGHYQDPAQMRHFSGARRSFPRSTAVQWAMEHPFLCAAAVAAIVAIGPRKVLRTVMAGSTAATSATAASLRDPATIDLLTRALTMVADVAQRSTARHHRP